MLLLKSWQSITQSVSPWRKTLATESLPHCSNQCAPTSCVWDDGTQDSPATASFITNVYVQVSSSQKSFTLKLFTAHMTGACLPLSQQEHKEADFSILPQQTPSLQHHPAPQASTPCVEGHQTHTCLPACHPSLNYKTPRPLTLLQSGSASKEISLTNKGHLFLHAKYINGMSQMNKTPKSCSIGT